MCMHMYMCMCMCMYMHMVRLPHCEVANYNLTADSRQGRSLCANPFLP